MKAYEVSWEQNMGAGRGILCKVETDCSETALMVWQNCCADKLETEVRNAVISFNDGTVVKPFNAVYHSGRQSSVAKT